MNVSADDDGPDPVEAAIEARLAWAGHPLHDYTWSTETGLVKCHEHDIYVGSVDADHPRTLWTGDPMAVREAVRLIREATQALERHLVPYDDRTLAVWPEAITMLVDNCEKHLDGVMV